MDGVGWGWPCGVEAAMTVNYYLNRWSKKTQSTQYYCHSGLWLGSSRDLNSQIDAYLITLRPAGCYRLVLFHSRIWCGGGAERIVFWVDKIHWEAHAGVTFLIAITAAIDSALSCPAPDTIASIITGHEEGPYHTSANPPVVSENNIAHIVRYHSLGGPIYHRFGRQPYPPSHSAADDDSIDWPLPCYTEDR